MSSKLHESFDYIQNFDSTIQIYPRYASPINFVGQVLDGYKSNTVVLSKQAGKALAQAQQHMLKLGYSLLVYDGYRPQKAVDHIYKWSQQEQDSITKSLFYPYIKKNELIPKGFVDKKSGHSKGSAVDLTIISLDKKLHEPRVVYNTLTDNTHVLYLDDGSLPMCTHMDYFGPPSHQDTDLEGPEFLERRNLLRSVMKKYGFKERDQEWWHFSLENEPFPDTYFDFDIV